MLSFPKPTCIPLRTKRRYKAPRAVPHDANKWLHKAGTGGELGVSAQKAPHTTQTEAGQTDAGRVQREKQGLPAQSPLVVAQQESDPRRPEAKGPVSVLDRSQQGQLGRMRSQTSSPGVRKSSAGDARKLDRMRGPFARSSLHQH